MKIKYLSLKKLKEIKQNNYTSNAGRCYWDYQDSINERIYHLEEVRMKEQFDKRMKEEEEFEFYNFKLVQEPDRLEWILSNFESLMASGFFNKK